MSDSSMDSEEEAEILSRIYYCNNLESSDFKTNITATSDKEFHVGEERDEDDDEKASDSEDEDDNNIVLNLQDADAASSESSISDFMDDGRYFGDGPSCFNCGKSGHLIRDCPEASKIPCSLCGKLGHMRQRCPTEVCHKCNTPGHLSRNCPNRKRRYAEDERCDDCGLVGHHVSVRQPFAYFPFFELNYYLGMLL